MVIILAGGYLLFTAMRPKTVQQLCLLDHTIHSDSEDSPIGGGVFFANSYN